MKKPIIESLKFVLQTFLQWLLGHLFGVLFGTTFLATISLHVAGKYWNPLKELLHTPIVNQQISLTLFLIILGILYSSSLLYIGARIYAWRTKNKEYFFINEGGFLWEVDSVLRHVTNTPFCQIHKYKLTELKEGFCCDSCLPKKNFISHKDVYTLLKIIQNKAEAKIDGYIK